MKTLITAAAVVAVAGTAMGQTIDGMINESSYQLLFENTLGTGFGNNESEINGVYGYIAGGNLYLGVTGNVSNFNKLELFFDTRAGGQNTLRGDNADVDFNQLNTNLAGLTFDAGFDADYFLTYTVGNSDSEHFTSSAVLETMGGGAGGFQGGGGFVDGDQIVAAGHGGGGYTLSYNDSNTGGVSAFDNAPDSSPAGVMTGVEIAISLAEIGYTGGEFKIAGFINGSDHNFVSNQVIGGLAAGTANLGGDGAGNFNGTVAGIDFNQFDGNQFVVIPAPGSVALLGLGGLAAARRRR
ncbi:MAG: PEP-CTERM sorting domain-containing protein [Planctomycetota bacterium]